MRRKSEPVVIALKNTKPEAWRAGRSGLRQRCSRLVGCWTLGCLLTTFALTGGGAADFLRDGPGGPILILTPVTNSFSDYYPEILRTEGLNGFAVTNLTALSPALLTNYDVVLLGEMSLSAAQVTTLSNWVAAGGNLIAMRPDAQLAGLLGLTGPAGTLSERYLLVNTTNGPGVGIEGATMQFHGTADCYTLAGAARVATLCTNANLATDHPAVTLRSVGTNGGKAAAFTYDLARSIVYTRQGNPAWVDQNRDANISSDGVVRSDDLFYGAAPFDPQPDWVDRSKIAIPQADEQQRLLVNLLLTMTADKKLLPRFWYFPHGHKAVIVMTGDDHGNGGTVGRFDQYLAWSPTNGSVADWETIRGTSYVYPNTPLTDAQARAYETNGFEISLHATTGCSNYTATALAGFFSSQLDQFHTKFPSLSAPRTHRMHCVAWSGYTLQPEVEGAVGIRLDANYYYFPTPWVADRPGLFTGSGLPMRFATTNGQVIDVYQAATQMTDESGQSYPYTARALLERALGGEGYYGAFVANMHTDFNPSTGSAESDAIIMTATNLGVPVISAQQLLTWLDARNDSSISNLSRTTNGASFSVNADTRARGLQVLVPLPAGKMVTEVRRAGLVISHGVRLIKGIYYIIVPALTGDYQFDFAADSLAPGVSATSPATGATGVNLGVSVLVTFTEAMDATTINSNTITLRRAAGGTVPATVTFAAATSTAVLTPLEPLAASTAYTVVVTNGSWGVADSAGNPLANVFITTFTTTAQLRFSLWDDAVIPGTTVPGRPAASDPEAVELGLKFQSAVHGRVTGIRFYKSPANTGIHRGNLWTAAGANLAQVTFTNESATGWQYQPFATPVPIASNTTYVASYHAPSGRYAFTPDFLSAGVTNPPLRALASGTNAANGVFVYTNQSAFPTGTGTAFNYWVDVVLVTNPPVILISAIGLTNGNAVVTWTAIAGQNYRLQTKDQLTDPDWVDVVPDVTATGPTASATNAVAGAAQKLYRVLSLGE